MKNRISCLVLVLLGLYGCSKDEETGDNQGQAVEIKVKEEFLTQVTQDPGFITELGGMEVSFVLPKGEPKQLALYLHGDGGTHPHLGAVYRQVEYARNHNIILVVPTANAFKTRESGEKIPSWAKVQDTEGLSVILDAFIEKYDLPADKLLVETVSGGSHYYTNEFIHRSGDTYQAAAFVVCGGYRASGGFLWDVQANSEARDKHHIHFDYGTGDFLLKNIEESIAFYSDLGFRVTVPENLGEELHCGTDYSQGTIDFWENYTLAKE
ncbi:hypothetical protein [Sediminicola luteus]|uniref:Alpha/beta hydrolase n=1 Tax=Sediminicola luteus TaxID=319238 RepID=A0A2A4GDN2_9FLAO|nr:hypothetical protein [Sediminicola luteus]PCE66094.1 hypothetical protein B7P33_01995 [Sediminicola luteus]